MDRRKPNTLLERVIRRVAKKKVEVLVPDDFRDLGGRHQVHRALKQLVDNGKLVRIGYGLYCRTRKSSLTGKPVLAVGFFTAAQSALDRLGVPWALSRGEVAFLEGRSDQIPANAVLCVHRRFRRRIAYRTMELRLEK